MPSTIATLAGRIADQADQLRHLANASGHSELRQYAKLVAMFARDCEQITRHARDDAPLPECEQPRLRLLRGGAV